MLGQGLGLPLSEAPPAEAAADPLPAQPAKAPVHADDAVLFGILCALWARYIGRRPWLWFFLGLLFQVLAVLTLVVKGSPALPRAPA
jgi:hypothetical protein